MANYFSAFLSGVTGEGNQFKDFQHATRLYVDDLYALAPKQGFLYYVVFEIEESVLPTDSQWTNNRKREIGLLVKGCDLPKFSVDTQVLNQYNRKTYVQSKINYTPINITFHDDHANVTNALWQNYYTYYFADAASSSRQFTQKSFATPPGYRDNKYEPNTNNAVFQHTDYGLNNDQDKPFFRAITMYQLNRKKFASYTLINPMITEWSHDRLEQSTNSKLLENKMTVGYETVVYGTGSVKKDSPSGFATFHYDTTPSPLSVLGGGSASLSGPGGVIDGISEIFGDLSTDGKMSGADIFQTAIKGANTIRNAKNLNGAAVAAEGIGLLTGVIKGFGSGQNQPSSVSAGVGAIGGGVALSLFRIKADKTTVAKSANVTNPTSSQVTQDDVAENGTANGQNVAPPTTTIDPNDVTGMEDQLSAQEELIADTQNQIEASSAMQSTWESKLAAAREAGDDEGQAEIMAQMAASNYTAPDKLQLNLNKLQTDRASTAAALEIANQNLQSPSTISVDISQIPNLSAEAAKYDSSNNADYLIGQMGTNSVNVDKWSKENYV